MPHFNKPSILKPTGCCSGSELLAPNCCCSEGRAESDFLTAMRAQDIIGKGRPVGCNQSSRIGQESPELEPICK